MYLEMAQQKAEKEERQKEMAPRERDYDQEQVERVKEVRERELETTGKVRQCNEGKWEFCFDEESKPGYVMLDVEVQKHLDSSLIDVDIHPWWVSVVIKSKVLRLQLPAEVKVGESKAQRSKTTGHLVLLMPKVNPKENMVSVRAAQRERQLNKENQTKPTPDPAAAAASSSNNSRVRHKARPVNSLADEMLKASFESGVTSSSSNKAVDIRGIVKGRHGAGAPPRMTTVSSSSKQSTHPPPPAAAVTEMVDDEDVPPLV